MKKTLIVIVIINFIFFIGCNKATVNKQIFQASTVIIDAGHGGKDAGAIGFDGYLEKNINLSIALDLYDFLSCSGINCKLTRTGDNECYKQGEKRIKSDLYNRMDFINSFNNSSLISIHQNHYSDESQSGCQVWYSANNEKSKCLADGILSAVKENLQPENKRLNKQSDNSYYLLYKAKVPSVMVECGFISNKDENIKLQNEKYQRELAYSILQGVCEEL